MATPTPPPVEPGGDTLVQPGRRVVVEQGPPLRPYPWWLWLLAAAFLVFALVFLVLWLLERGPRTRDVPNIVGEPVTQAQHDALTRGFALKVVRRAASQPGGTVLDQAPQPGAALERRATMMAVVSSGAAQAAVPDVVGLKLAAAQKVLSTARFVVQSTVVASTKPQGTVLSQDPPAGSRVARGSNVTLTVARGRALVAVPALQGLTEGSLAGKAGHGDRAGSAERAEGAARLEGAHQRVAGHVDVVDDDVDRPGRDADDRADADGVDDDYDGDAAVAASWARTRSASTTFPLRS